MFCGLSRSFHEVRHQNIHQPLTGKITGMDVAKCKALSLEIGMQNSGLGVALATAHFNPIAAVPSAIFSVWHNISGPIAAAIYRRMQDKGSADQNDPT